jgi:hypothetical protein
VAAAISRRRLVTLITSDFAEAESMGIRKVLPVTPVDPEKLYPQSSSAIFATLRVETP